MKKPARIVLKRTVLSCAIAMSAGALSQEAFAVDLCTGTSNSITTANPADNCSLDTAGESLAVSVAGSIGAGVVATVSDAKVTNAGHIVAAVSAWDATATAFSASGNVTANQANSGTIAATATATGTFSANATAYGIDIGGDVTSTITNTGTVSATANATNVISFSSAYAYAYTLHVGGALTGTLNNRGTLSAEANAWAVDNYAYAYATGLNVANGVTGDINNYGTISALANATAQNTSYASAYATAVQVSGNLAGQLTNSGTLSATANAYVDSDYADAYARGVYLAGDLAATGGITNTGTINAEANATGNWYYPYADARGIYVNGTTDGDILNRGTISASATVNVGNNTGRAYAYGVYLDGDLNGDLTNAGTISATASGVNSHYYGWARATTVHINGTTTGAINNSGTISATAGYVGQDYGSATADAIYISGNVDGGLTNTGTIKAKASSTLTGASHAYAYASGINIAGDLDSALTNAGTISADANAFAQNRLVRASATALYVGGNVTTVTGSIVNTGTISARSSATAATLNRAQATAYGIHFNSTMDGNLDNRGTIKAEASAKGTGTATATAYAVYLSSGGIGDISNRGVISATATANATNSDYAYAYAYGLYIDSSYAGDLTNDGTIKATANAKSYVYDSVYATAYAVYINGAATGDIVNHGTIRADATVVGTTNTNTAVAVALYVDGNGAAITNTGSILANARAVANHANYAHASSATGVWVAGDLGSFDNSGLIRATADAVAQTSDATAAAWGFYVDFSLTGDLTNTGTIAARSTAAATDNATANAEAFYIGTNVAGTVTNSGTISAIAVAKASGNLSAGYAQATATGAYVGTVNGGASLANNGTISAVAVAMGETSEYALAYGLYVTTLNGDVTNNGTIRAVADGSSRGNYGLYVSTGWGTVTNNGSIEGNIFTGGSVAVTNAGNITADGRSRIYGDYTQTARGSLTFVATDVGDYGQLRVDGTADFTAGNKVFLTTAPGATLHDGEVLNNVIFSLGLDAPNGFNVVDRSAFWDFDTSVDATSLDVTVRYVPAGSVLHSFGVSGSMATFLDGVIADGTTGSYADLAAALNGAGSATDAAHIVSDIMPTLAGAAAQATKVASTGATNVVGWRMAAGASSGDAANNGGVWIRPFFATGTQDGVKGVNGYDVDTNGFVLGLDGDASDAWRVGFAVGSSSTNVEGNAHSKIDISTVQIIGYGTYAMSDTTSLGLRLGTGNHGYDSSRYVSLANAAAAASYNGSSTFLAADLSHTIKMNDKTKVIPTLGLQLTKASVDGYQETGAGNYDLTVKSSDDESLIVSLRGAVEHEVSDKGTLLANLGIGFDTNADAPSTGAKLADAPSAYVVNGIKPEDMAIAAGVGYRYVTSKDLEVTANYDFENRSDFENSTVSVKLKMPF